MSDRGYIVGSGFIGGDAGRDLFSLIWADNLERNPDCCARKVVVVCARGQAPPLRQSWIQLIKCEGDLGHIRDQNEDRKTFTLEGWPATLAATALIAYNDECDLLFIEQDCLPFGAFVSKLYDEIGDGGCIMGNLSTQPCAQALMLIRHWFIPELVHGYIGKKISNRKLQGEQAFQQMEREMPGKFRRMSFGFDRDRPAEGFASQKGKVCYFQQISTAEVAELKENGLL